MFEDLTAAARLPLERMGCKDLAVTWVRPSHREFGDLATAVALRVAKKLKKSPKVIAEGIADSLRGLSSVERASVEGAGYVNVRLSAQALLELLAHTRSACTAKVKREKEAPVVVEYSSINIAKPLGVHHLLSTLIGQAVANLYAHAGYNVIRWNYLGDWGTQFGKLAVAYERWGNGKPIATFTMDELLALYVRFHRESEKESNLEDASREAFRKLEKGDPALRMFWEECVAISKRSMEMLYARLHVHFDLDLGESFYEDKMDAVITEGLTAGVFTEGEGGALIVTFSEESKLPTYMIRKSDGATLYSTRDIAQIRYRIDTYHPQAILYVVDVAQMLHFQQLFATVERIGWELPQLEHIVFGRMRFREGSMSTRAGTVLKLDEFLDEAVARASKVITEHGEGIQAGDPSELAEMMGVGAVAYGILSQNRRQDIVFDWNTLLAFEGNSAPYLQYTHARARSVLRKAELTHADPPPAVNTFSEAERGLIGTLLQFPSVLEDARKAHMPHLLATYLHELCQDYNAFYNVEPILKAKEPERALRLALTSCTADVLHVGAELLALRVPDRM